MGADMIVAVVAIRKNDKPDFEAGRKFLSTVDFSDEGLATALVDDGLDEDDCFDADGKPLANEIKLWMLQNITDFEQSLNCRATTTLHVRDLMLYMTGGMSWGDMNDEAYHFWRMGAVPGLLESMNFVVDWDEEEKQVTPEEEQAAVQSIVGVTT